MKYTTVLLALAAAATAATLPNTDAGIDAGNSVARDAEDSYSYRPDGAAKVPINAVEERGLGKFGKIVKVGNKIKDTVGGSGKKKEEEDRKKKEEEERKKKEEEERKKKEQEEKKKQEEKEKEEKEKEKDKEKDKSSGTNVNVKDKDKTTQSDASKLAALNVGLLVAGLAGVGVVAAYL